MFSPQPLFNTAKIADTNNEIIRCRVPLCEVKKVIGQMFLCVWGSPWWSFRAAIVSLVCMCRPRSSFAYTGQYIMYLLYLVFVCMFVRVGAVYMLMSCVTFWVSFVILLFWLAAFVVLLSVHVTLSFFVFCVFLCVLCFVVETHPESKC